MPEYNEPPQTLRQALIAEGSQQQADLLTEDLANLTQEDFLNIVNNADWAKVSETDMIILRDISVTRLRNGQPVFPWNDEAFLNAIDIATHQFHHFVY